MLHLIADSGIQFHTTEAVFNPSGATRAARGRPLKYSFCKSSTSLPASAFRPSAYHAESGRYIPVTEPSTSAALNSKPTAVPSLDDMGVEVARDIARVALHAA